MSWRARALCAEVGGDVFFPEKGEPAGDAKAVCARCPVQGECLWDALERGDVTYGVLGGMSPQERRGLLAKYWRAA